jgi:glycosyltransferase involved in cell wall biosynthesis
MRIALIAPPFISVPPPRYGGTELFIDHLAKGLRALGHEPVVYANGESTVAAEVRWMYAESEWPTSDPLRSHMKNMTHTAWAVKDAAEHCDLMHVNDVPGVFLSSFVDLPFVHTLHHPKVEALSEVYARHPEVWYVSISDHQRRLEPMPRLRTIYHGLDTARYRFTPRKEDYVCFLGRLAPCKGPHLAIEVARRAGLRLKLAGEIQPVFRDYWERDVKPHVDGRFVEYLGEADLAMKNELLGNARALLFPIQWEEPFGLVMIEAMACGTPVVALSGGSVDEVVGTMGEGGVVCRSADEMVRALAELDVRPARCRERVVTRFSLQSMARDYESLYYEAGECPKTSSATRIISTSSRPLPDPTSRPAY